MSTADTVSKLFDLTGMTALVTGGGDGIGRGCCEILAAAGANVVVANRTYAKAEAVADAINAGGGHALPVGCDVTDTSACDAAVKAAIDSYGALNILVNNAGHGGGGTESPFNIDLDYVERIYRVNVFAPWYLTKIAAPLMQTAGYGSVINITSMSSVNNSPGMSIYGSSKAALNHMAENLAYDLGPMGIRINNVGPGATRTRALSTVMTPALEHRMLAHTPIKRLGEVSDVAAAVLYFASPASAWVSGQSLMVNGGGVQTLD